VKAAGKGLALHNPKYVRNLFKQKVMMKTKGGARELWQAFRHFDKDGSGDIDFDEFHHVVVDHYNIDLPREEVRAMFNEFIERGNVFKQEREAKLGAAKFARMSKNQKKMMKMKIMKNNQAKKSIADADFKTRDDDSEDSFAGETKRSAAVIDPFAATKTAWGAAGDDEPVPQNDGGHPCAPKLRRMIKKQWRAILSDLSSMDTSDTGLVSRAEARFVFGKYRVTLTDKEIIALTPKNSSPKNPALIDYRIFLASFGKC
jgi:hypothetical protein